MKKKIFVFTVLLLTFSSSLITVFDPNLFKKQLLDGLEKDRKVLLAVGLKMRDSVTMTHNLLKSSFEFADEIQKTCLSDIKQDNTKRIELFTKYHEFRIGYFCYIGFLHMGSQVNKMQNNKI